MNSIPAPKKKRRWVLPVACTGALLAGVGIGSTAQPEPEVITETITEEVEVIVTETEEVEVEVETIVEVAPASCVSAIEAGDDVIDLLWDLIDHSMDAMDAASRLDPAGITAATDRVTEMTPAISDAGFDWGFWSEACKEAGE